MNRVETILVKSDAFTDGGRIPVKHTGFGEDISPGLRLSGIHKDAVSMAVTMDDLDIPFLRDYNHWTLWNLPVSEAIEENVPHGPVLESLGGAVQGVGYGKNRYRGPKPPSFIRGIHRYVFSVHVLDCLVDLDAACGKKSLLKAIDGHVLQQGSITGVWSNAFLPSS